ncbi:MAG: 6-bladed beta-propeller [Gammaproteobacteria bacterium]|nr:6-bladed beta-propeller [Gammaproteobacteria bacterium]
MTKFLFKLVCLILFAISSAACTGDNNSKSDETNLEKEHLNNNILSITFDDTDKMYISDVYGNIYIYNDEALKLFISQNSSSLNYPKTIRHSQTNLFVQDTYGEAIFVFSITGQLVNTVSPILGKFGFIRDFDINSKGQMFIALNDERDKIIRLNSDGTGYIEFDLTTPSIDAVKSIAFSPDNYVFVGTQTGLYKFSEDGEYLKAIALRGDSIFYSAEDIAIDPSGNIVVASYYANDDTTTYLVFNSNDMYSGFLSLYGYNELPNWMRDMVYDSSGNFYLIHYLNGIYKFDQSGGFQGIVLKPRS